MFPRQDPATPTRTLGEQAIVITPHDSVLHTLNATGTFIWELCDGTRSLDEIAQACAKEFDVSEEMARKEAADFVQHAANSGLIELLEERLAAPASS